MLLSKVTPSQLADAEVLSEQFDNFIFNEPENWGRRKPGLHASEISGCLRVPVYTMTETEKKGPIPVAWRKRFNVGNAVHDMLQGKMKAMAASSKGRILFDCEVPIAPGLQPLATKWGIHSHCDGVFTHLDEDCMTVKNRVIVEIKSKSPDEFKKLVRPEDDHVEQAHVYMACLGVPMAWLLYYNKGNQNTTPSRAPYLVPFEERIWKRLEERFKYLHELNDAVKRDAEGKLVETSLPLRTETVRCEFCSYNWTCQPSYLERRETNSYRTIHQIRRSAK